VIDRRPEGRAVLCGNVVASDELLLPWSDPAVQWGLGVFETLAVREAAPRHLDDHLRRLSAAAQRLGVPLPPASELVRAVRLVAEGAGGQNRWLKILVSRSGPWAVFAGPSDPNDVGREISAVVLPWRRHRLDPTAGIKSMSYAASILGLEEARRLGADEGLWLNERGHVFQACAGNVFVVRGRAVDTPSLKDGARDGVMRALAIEVLRAFGLSVRQSKIRIATLRAADEVFLTSSLCGVRPVVRIDARSVRGGAAGPVSRRLAGRLLVDDAAHAVSDERKTPRGA
jgi:branched-subunit amino acid aminotransferase/4-amino-4-deoxychorismate lyase